MLSPPTLTLVQALLSGAMLMQFLGNMPQSWMMTSFAARSTAFLNHHVYTSDTFSEQTDEMKLSMAWCFYLDKVLSALFRQPPSLPKLDFDSVTLTQWDAFPLVFQFVLEMASIMDRALELQLRKYIIDYKNKPHMIVQDETQTDWIAGTLCHHTLLNSFFQLRFNLFMEKKDQGKYLENARKALTTFHHLQNRALHSNPSQPNASFFAWTILLFPLHPFFSLFCDVVGTSNLQDLQLMQSITSKLSPFRPTSKSAAKLHRLFMLPYDDVVTSIMLRAYMLMPDAFKIHSDGDWRDWRSARHDCRYLFGEEPKCPWAGKKNDKTALEVLYPIAWLLLDLPGFGGLIEGN
ncbi:hypothetical protein SI65_04322 [Aspergillus cristatus]|uniref:Xylanolytic transcriptional activator regulatory domain-containing protein n=1 Tax=Aspergillus cristatus TaxID=573508 RepID=A0A1E3BK03_ASPCR|nr:hypothetical protein SI65_04322 [Aspergillus cristatus]